MHHRSGLTATAVRLLLSAMLVGGVFGCATQVALEDPLGALMNVQNGPRTHIAAMEAMDGRPDDEAYLKALHRTVWHPGYTVDVREAAVDRLAVRDVAGLKRTLRQHLPRMAAWQGLTRLCEIIAERGWTDLSPALVSSWAQPAPFVKHESDRPEYKALARLHGSEHVPDVVFEMLVKSNKVSQQGLRTRCWELMHRLGYRDRLIGLLSGRDLPPDDVFLLDLQAGAEQLGLVPHNREEILWLRNLCKPEHRAFWEEAVNAVEHVPPRRRCALEIRDLPVVVSAWRHEPELLSMTESDLYARLDATLRGRKHHWRGTNWGDPGGEARERLADWRRELTWGDLAAMHIALRALAVPQVVDHLFDYAGRDQLDESTEYGGVIQLDRKGRFEILEFPPRIREHDRKFNASQAMLDAAYEAVFHFHMHVQRHRNADFAGPGYGDLNYADAMRANCLVFTFINKNTLNADFYRHGRVAVDLGDITRR